MVRFHQFECRLMERELDDLFGSGELKDEKLHLALRGNQDGIHQCINLVDSHICDHEATVSCLLMPSPQL